MAVTIDAKSIRAQLRQFGDGMLLMARSKPVLSAELVRGAARTAEAEESTPWMGSVLVIPAGVVIGLEGPVEDVLAYVDRFAVELGSHTDVDVKLGAATQHSWPAWLQSGGPVDDSLSAWLAHSLSDYRAEAWAVDDAATRLLAAAVAREMDLSDAHIANIGGQLTVNHAGVSISEMAPMLVRANPSILFVSGRREPLTVRSAQFLGPGTVSVWFGRQPGGVPDSLAAGRRLLTVSPETAVYGAVVTGRPDSTPEHLPLVGRSDYFLWSQFWDRVVPDAYGMQVLGPTHLERVGDLSGWVTTRLDGGRYLVEARDLDAWFASPAPDPAAQAAARNDFASIILTADFMRLHPIAEGLEIRINSASARGTLAGGDG